MCDIIYTMFKENYNDCEFNNLRHLNERIKVFDKNSLRVKTPKVKTKDNSEKFLSKTDDVVMRLLTSEVKIDEGTKLWLFFLLVCIGSSAITYFFLA